MWLTELFFNYFPMYNKFRAVESILIVAEITVPWLAFLGLKALSDKQVPWERVQRSILISGGVTAGICALVALLSGSIDATSSYDASWKAQVGQQIYALWVMDDSISGGRLPFLDDALHHGGNRHVQLVRGFDAEADRQTGLWIGVHQKHFFPGPDKADTQADRGDGLPNAALLIGNGDYLALVHCDTSFHLGNKKAHSGRCQKWAFKFRLDSSFWAILRF